MLLKVKTKQVLYFPLVPIGSVYRRAEAGNRGRLRRNRHADADPVLERKEKQVGEAPFLLLFVNDDSGKGATCLPKKKLAHSVNRVRAFKSHDDFFIIG